MKLKSILFLCFFCWQSHFSLQAANELPLRFTSIAESNMGVPLQTTGSIQAQAQQDLSFTRICFSTRSGFLLLRKEDILSVSIHKLYGGLLLQYWNRGTVKTTHCQGTLTGALENLDAFPFFQVNRAAIVNLHEVSEYVGTRRFAHLVLRDGSTVKVSRNRTALIYDWIERGGVVG
jgi:DNA-binding LytR/AlgR family response regulator